MWDADKIERELRARQDVAYREFHGGLTFTSYERIGVRVPALRALAKEIIRSGEWEDFLSVRPFSYYEHVMLAGIVSASVKEPYEDKIARLRDFAKYEDDWAVCDVTCASLKCNDARLAADMKDFASSPDVWTARTGLVVILGNFADEEHEKFLKETLDKVTAKGYYIDMAEGWLICTAESRCEGLGIRLMQNARISDEVTKIAASKMRDSFRVSEQSKEKAAETAVLKIRK